MVTKADRRQWYTINGNSKRLKMVLILKKMIVQRINKRHRAQLVCVKEQTNKLRRIAQLKFKGLLKKKRKETERLQEAAPLMVSG